MRGRTARWVTVLFMAMAGAVAGLGIGCSGLIPPQWDLSPSWKDTTGLPHHAPKYWGGVSLRFAMVHDVLHERFARHGKAYYAERNRRVRQELQKMADPNPNGKLAKKYFGLQDDLGAGLDYLGEH